MTTEPNSNPAADASAHTMLPLDSATELHEGLPGRSGLWMILCLFSIVSLLSFIGFVYQFNFILPTGEMYVRTQPMWVFSHLVRGVGLAILSWQLFCYVNVIKKLTTLEDLQQIARRHASLWTWAAIVLLTLVGYSIVTVMFDEV